jgi:hypothetical protein
LAGSLARAQSADDVESLVRRGVALRQRGDDAGALGEFERALARSPEPRVLAQVALAEQALGRWLDADRHLRAAVAAGADPWIIRNAALLRQAGAELGAHLGWVRVAGAVAGAEVYANDERVATLPMAGPARVAAGTNVLEVRAPGYVTMTRRVEVDAGREARETFAFVREAPVPVVVAVVPTVVPAPAALATPDAAPRPGGVRRTLAWTALAVGAAGVGVGVFALARRDGLVSTYDERRDPVCPGTGSATQPSVCAGYLAEIDAMQALAVGGLAAGGALALASVVLFATAPSAPGAERAAVSVRCGGGPGTVGVSCAGTF